MELFLDVETTTFNKGNPFDSRNKLVSIHAYDGESSYSFIPTNIYEVQNLVDKASLIVGFNFKFDYHWLRKAGVNLEGKLIYDVQLAHFMLSHQRHRLPSLDEVLAHHGIPLKIKDAVHEYWNKGIQTDEIPWPILCEYGEYDTKCLSLIKPKQVWTDPKHFRLFTIACADLVVLEEMEWNGLKYDSEKCQQKSEQLQVTIQQLTNKLALLYPDVPINFNSADQLSAFLYGGIVKEDSKEMIGFFKTGLKAGQPKYKNIVIEHQLPRLFEPPKKKMAKEGQFPTDNSTLRKLKGKNKWIIDTLLELAKLTKLDETYYQGMNKINADMCWPKDMLHGQFNQCIAGTGRLSSSKPNLQNLSGDALEVFVSRYV